MREIKFRAWDKAFDKMINFDDTLAKEWILGLTLWGDVIGCDLKALEPKSSHETYIITYPERFELMQYTGLKDSKRTEEYPEGQEICEGDILLGDLTILPKPHVVEFEYGMFIAADKGKKYIPLDEISLMVSVIGNIHDTPDLLKEVTP